VWALRNILEPVSAGLRVHVRHLAPFLSPALAVTAPRINQGVQWAEQQLEALKPWQIMLVTVIATLLVSRLLRALRNAVHTVQDKGALLSCKLPCNTLVGRLLRWLCL
jgi:hypothetical protein